MIEKIKARKLKSARGEQAGSIFEDCLVESDKFIQIDSIDGIATEIDRPALPKEFDDIHIDNIPSIGLPNGKCLFYCRFRSQDFIKFLEHLETDNYYVADSWEDLFYSGYEFLEFVFNADGTRAVFFGEDTHFNCRLSELQVGDHVDNITVPGLFAGDQTPVLSIDQTFAEHYFPLSSIKESDVNSNNLTKFFFFFVENFSIVTDEKSYLQLEGGVQWWPSISFPGAELFAVNYKNERLNGMPPLPPSGVLLVPMNDKHDSYQRRYEGLELAAVSVQRLRTSLSLICNASLIVRGKGFISKGQNGQLHSQLHIEMDTGYRKFNCTHWVRQTLFPPSIIQKASEIAFSIPKKKNLLSYVQSAIDSLDLARSINNKAISHILIWASLEAIISPSDKSELISNMTLCLLGLNNDLSNRLEFWNEAKKSYSIRSKIVHGFELPADNDCLTKAIQFSDSQCCKIIQYAIDQLGSNNGRDLIIKQLREKAL